VPITIRQQTPGAGGTGTALVATFPGPTQAGNGIIVLLGSLSRDATSITDGGDTFVHENFNNFAGATFSSQWRVSSGAGGLTAVQANFASSTSATMVAVEVFGTLTIDLGNSHAANGSNATPGAITTTGANRIVFSCLQDTNISAFPSGWTGLENNGTSNGFAAAYNVYTSVQTGLNPTWTNTTGSYVCLITAYSSSINNVTTWNQRPVIPALTDVYDDLAQQRRMPPALLPGTTPSVSTWSPRRSTIVVPDLPFLEKPAAQSDRPKLPFGFAPSPLPPGPGKGKKRPFFRRLSAKDDARRLREVHDKISVCLNALVAKGILRQVETDQWMLVPGAHVGQGPPTPEHDVTQGFQPGAPWLDENAGKMYFCASNSAGAAVWLGPLP
jgi:hypothetical protein